MKLDDPVSILPRVGPKYVQKLKVLGITSIEDLLLHVPARHIDFRNKVQISDLKIAQDVTIAGQVVSIKNVYAKSGKVIQLATISDGENMIDAIWMRQPYLVRALPVGTFISLSGKLSFWGKKRAFLFPTFEKFTGETIHTGRLVPVYPETNGLNSKWLRISLSHVLENTEIDDFLDESELMKLEFTGYRESFVKTHKPETIEDFEQGVKRLAFNELLLLQIQWAFKKLWWEENTNSQILKINDRDRNAFTTSLPFELTESQTKTISEILSDLGKETPMNRLLEGDVGSGKTVVAAAGAFASFKNSKKSVFMAPTQILANQHFDTLNQILSPFNARVSLVTSAKKTPEPGDVIVGTHALLYRENLVQDASFLVIDEQHRFGVSQRAKIAELAAKGSKNPHVLTMTATPIPRTIALTIYGDLELSTLNQLPPGRHKTKTWVVPANKRAAAEKWIDKEIKENKAQVFVVCPLIEGSEADTMSEVKAATKEFVRLKKVFKNYKITLLHGKMKPEEKDKNLEDFRKKRFDILVSTPVIEVGVDVPDATIMVIEGADRFGLASLHQLRGRVGRSNKQSYCLLFTGSKSTKIKERLEKVAKAKSGLELAEIDLKLRGPGQLLGLKQHGIPELRIARWDDLDLISKSRELAKKVVKNQNQYKKVLKYYRKKQVAPN